LALLFHLATAAPAEAVAVAVTGAVDVETAAGTTSLVPFTAIPEGATVATGKDGRASLRLKSGSLVRMGPDSRLLLSELVSGTPAAVRREKVKLLVGRIWARVMGLVGQESHFEIETASAVAGVRGTAVWAQSGALGDRFVLEHGTLVVRHLGETVSLDGPGASAVIGPTGLVFDGYAGPYALDGLRFDTGGAAAQLLYRTDPRNALRLAGETGREHFRQQIRPPDSIADTPIGVPGAADQLRGLADVTVKIVLPTR
jgi:hypothetical protein